MQKLLSFALLALMATACQDDGKSKNEPAPVTTGTVLPPSPGTPPIKILKPVTLGELSCQDAGGYITECSFQEKTLAEKQTEVTRFTLSYDFDCKGDSLPLVVDLEGTQIPLVQEAGKTLVVYGFGPFLVKDSDPELTASGSLQPGCKLTFNDFKAEAL